jgi:IS5 family transposase
LNRVVEEGRALLAQLGAEEKEEAEVAEAAALLRRVLAQDLEPLSPQEDDAGKRDDDEGSARPSSPERRVLTPGTEVQIRRGVAKDRIVSVGDPEMRHGHKSRQRTWEGYKAHLSAEAGHGFTTAVEVTPANVRDAQAAPELIRAQKEVGLESPAQVGDMAYSDADLRRQAEREGTKIVARVPPRRPAGGRFSKANFRIDPEARTATCPAGHTTRRFIARSEGGGSFFFNGALCASCALRDRCTSKDPEQMRHSGRGRTIIVHRLESVLQQARADEQTSQTQALLALRPIAERSFAHLVARGLRRARYFGTAKVEFQALAIALTVNVARLGKLLWLQPELEPAWAMAG